MPGNSRNTNSEEFTPTGKNRTQLDDYIDTKLAEYQEGSDGILWAMFTQDFKDWTLEQLKTASVLRLAKLIILLKSHGVYVDETNAHLVAVNVHAAATEENPHQWTEGEVITHLRKGRTFESLDINARFASVIAANPPPRGTATTVSEPKTHVRTDPDTPTPQPGAYTGRITRSRSALDPALNANAAPGTPYQVTRSRTPFTPAPISRTIGAPTTQQQEIPEPQEQEMYTASTVRQPSQYTITQAIANVGKCYANTPELRYKGLKDSFQRKARIFYGYCRQSGLPANPELYREAMPHMLKDLALAYYWDNIDTWIAQSKDPALEIEARFETPEHKRTTQSEWSAISLDNTIRSNPGKSMSECLNLMITELQDLFYCLPDELQNQTYWHMKLIEATSTHPGCDWATSKPAPTVPGLIQDLQSSIKQYERRQQNGAHGINFTDRHYNIRRPSRSPHRGRSPSLSLMLARQPPRTYGKAYTGQ
ncbi:hypothetical protein ZTR_08197 [Talaromyces verruculosus]|nr:hypothetical protein ZTR_08197 [Talaromyces verruculosus]